MLIVQAKAMGMCFGVEDALGLADRVATPDEMAILGEIVHNGKVQASLLARGFHNQAEDQRAILPEQPRVMVTAHGISDSYRQRLQAADKEILDTTCPLVTRVHKTAHFLVGRGYRLVLVGKLGHVEVLGITEDHPSTVVFGHDSEVYSSLGEKLAVLAQTTTPPDLYQRVLQRVKLLHPHSEVRAVDTICRPTRDRQEAISELLQKVEALVVVGGKHSNNSQRLLEQALHKGLPGWRVEGAEELQPEWFQGIRVLGLTAGTSTPRGCIEAVHRRLLQIGRQLSRERRASFCNSSHEVQSSSGFSPLRTA